MADYGKKFENIIRETLEQAPNISVDRIYDQTSGYFGSANIADFQVYKLPYNYYLECKTTSDNTLPMKNISEGQLTGMYEKSLIPGIVAGVIIWFYDKGITVFIEVEEIHRLIASGYKSVNVKDLSGIKHILLKGNKKRIFYDYDGEYFMDMLQKLGNEKWNQ